MSDNAAPSELEKLIEKNLKVIKSIELRALESRSTPERISDKIAGFCGSMPFIYLHIVWFGAWLAINTLPFVPKSLQFDKPPFQTLTLIVSLEAIFLTTFVLISENRQQRMSEKRNELDLQINLIAEQETSKIIQMLANIQTKLGIHDDRSKELANPVDAAELATAVEEKIIKANESET